MNQVTKDLIDTFKKYPLENNEDYILEQSKDNRKVLRVKKNGRFVYIGSRYNVQRDIDKFMSNLANINSESIIIVFGFGTGEHILQLMKELTCTNKIIIIEPDEKILLKNILYNQYINKIFADDRVIVFNSMELDLNQFLHYNIDDVHINNIELATYANYDKLYTEEYNLFYENFIDFINERAINLNTALYHTHHFFESYINNIKIVLHSTIINNFKEKFKGVPAIVVSAGPSLERNIHLLKDFQDKFLIITGGRTLKTLIDIGIRPDFVCVIDPGEGSYKVIEKAIDSDVPLVFEEVSNYKVTREYSGKKIFFSDIDFIGITEELLKCKVDVLLQGGSVAHVCASLAVYLGCNNIIFVGQDFAYTNDRYHADIASLGNENTIATGTKYIYVDDVYGNKVRTSQVLDIYRKQMEKIIKQYPLVNFVNSTEGGANIKGTIVKPLKESIEKYAVKVPLNKNIDNLLNKSSSIDKKIVIENLNKISLAMDRVEILSFKAIKYTTMMYDYYDGKIFSNIDYIIGKLDKIDNELDIEVKKVKILKKLYVPLVARIMTDLTYKGKQDETEREKGKRIATKNRELYKGLNKIMKESKKYIEDLIKELM
ncbi:hypothetical protein CLTEP_12720 [Clostridium tepidiprofundi DSM 19306]|uniref:6-hydroxymethylpterin diphosphokinase MptE-like domain-containing protein n=1 Tax=Clostridium tepidiprofundi DSM 19306 TaxID=1121338 RepID=A0A151B572_9CLOT|nr:6-hydroxymethylpterin diphosphokinase MptE-like protein [Clostridium tepidiprofundi]KYH34807.1 hypothetical protein CLTEP_12720 [Clostridium tepidiprofundi DSM 19306]